MVNQDRVQLLIDALESDEFPQTQGKLCTVAKGGTRKWCCLGVGTIVAIRNGLNIDESLEIGNGTSVAGQIRFHDIGMGGDSSATILTEKVKQWYGFDNADPILTGKTVIAAVGQYEGRAVTHCCPTCDKRLTGVDGYSATTCNDTYKMTFAQIAQAFRETFITNNPRKVSDEAA